MPSRIFPSRGRSCLLLMLLMTQRTGGLATTLKTTSLNLLRRSPLRLKLRSRTTGPCVLLLTLEARKGRSRRAGRPLRRRVKLKLWWGAVAFARFPAHLRGEKAGGVGGAVRLLTI